MTALLGADLVQGDGTMAAGGGARVEAEAEVDALAGEYEKV